MFSRMAPGWVQKLWAPGSDNDLNMQAYTLDSEKVAGGAAGRCWQNSTPVDTLHPLPSVHCRALRGLPLVPGSDLRAALAPAICCCSCSIDPTIQLLLCTCTGTL